MKNIFKYACAALSALALTTSCGDFGDLNVDPEHLNDGNIDMNLVFSNAQHQALGSDWDAWRNGLIYLSQWNQHISAGGWWWSYAINSYSNDYAVSYWASVYSGGRGAVKDAVTCKDKWEVENSADAQVNTAMADVVFVYVMQRLTDLHGDLPYFQASQPGSYSYPVYDKQEAIYDDMLQRLDDDQAKFGSGTSTLGSHDLWYNGDLGKWKKFTNSLMLRVAMRLSKIAPDKAKTWAAKAYANGVILDNVDDCFLLHSDGTFSNDSAEPYAKIISHEDQDVPYISRTFMEILGDDDPRIPLIMSIYPETDGEMEKDYIPDAKGIAWCAPQLQRGLPSGVSMVVKAESGSEASVQWWYPEYTEEMLKDKTSPNYYKRTHSRPNHYTYGDWTAPTWVVTAAQTNFLLAEAAERGWISGKSASEFYKDGVRCACKQFAQYPNKNAKTLYDTYLTERDVEVYLEKHPYKGGNEGIQQVNEQYWINCFCDEYETYANWRRSGYPVLKELCSKFDKANKIGTYVDGKLPSKDFKDLNLYPAKGGATYDEAIVRRFPYPTGESTANRANLKAALDRQGINGGNPESDFNNSRVWWDKK